MSYIRPYTRPIENFFAPITAYALKRINGGEKKAKNLSKHKTNKYSHISNEQHIRTRYNTLLAAFKAGEKPFDYFKIFDLKVELAYCQIYNWLEKSLSRAKTT